MGIEKGDSFIVANSKNDIKLVPAGKGNMEIEMEFSSIDVFAGVIDMLARNDVKILSSNSSGSRWRAILEANEGDMARRISSMRGVRHVKIRAL